MRPITIFILLLTFSYGYCQNDPDYFLNSERNDNLINYYIKPSNLENIRVEKKTKNGAIYIETKSTGYLTLDYIVKKHTGILNINKSMIFFINDKLILDKEKIRIDSCYNIYVKVERLEEIKYTKRKYKNLIILNITLSDTLIRTPKMYLRGSNIPETILK